MTLIGGRPAGVGDRPHREREQVAAVGVAVDVPPVVEPTADRSARRSRSSRSRRRSSLTWRSRLRRRRPPGSRTHGAGSVPARWVASRRVTQVLPDHPDLLRQRRAPPRPRVHDDHRRRGRAVAPPARRGRPLPHRHRRARSQDPAGGRGGGQDAAGVHRRDRAEVPGGVEVARHLQRRLHPHHRAAPPAGVQELLQRATTPATSSSTCTPASTASSCEEYYTDDELLDGRPVPDPQARRSTYFEEENYFFRLSRFQDRLLDWYAAHPTRSCPSSARNEALGLIRGGLRDFSVSRTSVHVGHPAAVGPEARRLRVVRRAHQLHTAVGFGDRRAATTPTGGRSTTT